MADDSSADISTDFSKLKVPDLKKELKLRGLSTTGNKTELLERLQSTLKSNENVSSESVDELEEDLLNDEDDEHLEASESLLENDLDEAPMPTKRKISETSDKDTKIEPPKKIVLDRNNSTGSDIVKSVSKTPEKTSDEDKTDDKKIIKLSELSAKERLEMRAKKFGVTDLSVDAKRAVRAERFASNSATSITSSTVNTNVDVLNKRAARFGISASGVVVSSSETNEKLEKRKLRFGSESGNNTISDDEKAKLRLERFKQPVT